MSDCIIWKQGQSQGYGIKNVKVDGRWSPTRTHRLAYEAAYGPIPPGMAVHHKCGTRRCINPDHLELVTPQQHRERHRLTHCQRGHDLADPANTYIRPDTGHRMCRICQEIRQRARHALRQSAKGPVACAVCGVTFIARRDAMYCSSKCKYHGYLKDYRARRKAA